MKLEDILKEWEVDCVIDTNQPDYEAAKIPKLHSKYVSILAKERLVLQQLNEQTKRLTLDLHEYYNGTLPQEDLKERGWSPNPREVLKASISMFVSGHQDMINHNLRVHTQQVKVETLVDIIKQINNRNFHIKAFIDWQRFTNVPG